MKKEHSLDILDCTLRDGSYAVNFQFTAVDTELICRDLEAAGIRWIEVGHGVGLHGSEAGYGSAAETDESYLKAAAKAVKKSHIGVFCIPGIARVEDIDLAADNGAGFVRVGTSVSDVDKSQPFIDRAKKRGLKVMANFMKSYATPPKEFAVKAQLSRSFGADTVYIVDSAGGMLQDDLENYFKAVREICDVPLGFHGHNNLGLAVAHSLRAAELDASIIDSTLQGLGRSSGNAPTELLLAGLDRMGFQMGIDFLQVLDIGERYVKPLIKSVGLDSLDVIAGFAQFHSSYMGVIREFSSRYRIDPRRLIIELCKRDKVNAPKALVEEIAKRISEEPIETSTARFRWDKYFGEEQNENNSDKKSKEPLR